MITSLDGAARAEYGVYSRKRSDTVRTVHFPIWLLIAFVVFFCASPVLAQDGLRTAVQRDQRTRFYPGEKLRHVMEESAHIFELAQAGYRVVYGKRGVIAHREWGWETALDDTIDLGVGGSAYWYLSLTQEDGGVVVRVRSVAEPDPYTPLDPAEHEGKPGSLVSDATMDQATPQPGEDQAAAAMYAVFFNRLDVLLGQNRFWLYCRAGKEFVKMERLTGKLDAWCVDAGDLRPGAKLP